MLRNLILAALLMSSASAAIWPQKLGTFERTSASALHPDRAGDDEYGLDAVEEADYGQFKVLASRYKDSTGAYAAWLEAPVRPLQVGNYLITCTGNCPKNLAGLLQALPQLSHAPLPVLKSYLPAKNLVQGSERYIMGPVGLHADIPEIQASAVALQFGTEGEVAHYRSANGEATLAIFSYPTPQIARQQAPAFQAIPGAAVKRTGAFVAIVLLGQNQSASDGEAQKILSQVNYQASLQWNEPLPIVIKPETVGQMLLGIINLAGIVLGFCLVSGLAFAAIRRVARRFGYSDAGTTMTTLHLGGK